MDLKSYKNKEVEVYTTLPVSWYETTVPGEEKGEVETAAEIGDENIIAGKCIAADDESMVVEYDKRGRTHRWQLFRAQIVGVHTSELNEVGMAASTRAKERFGKAKKKKSKK